MSSRPQSILLALLLLSPWAVAADCEGPITGVAERDFVASLYAPGTIGDANRSQLGRPHPANAGDVQDHLPGFPTAVFWDGTQAQVNIQMSPSIDLSAQLLDENGGAAEDSCLILDGLGKLPDRGLRGEPVTGLIGRSLVPGEYSAILAPDCFLSDRPAEWVDSLALIKSQQPGTELSFEALTSVSVAGRVEFTDGEPIDGAVLTLFSAVAPEQYLGSHSLSSADGGFSLTVPAPPDDCGAEDRPPCPTYDVLVSTPRDGSIPLPPIRLQQLVLPPPSGGSLLVRYPPLPTTVLRGQVVVADDGTPFPTRLHIEGDIPEPPNLGHQFEGGLFRAELLTDAEGRFELEVPSGSYLLWTFPSYDDSSRFDRTELAIEVPPGVELLDGLEVGVPLASLARVEVVLPDGRDLSGADLILRMQEPPAYTFRRQTSSALGGWAGPLMSGTYDVEVIPPQTENIETGQLEKTHARAHSVLNHGASTDILELQLQRADGLSGFVYGPVDSSPSSATEGLGGLQVQLRDPASGELLDEAVTASGEGAGFFRAVLPRP